MSAAEHVRVWLARRLTGCRFAASLAGPRDGILFSVFPGTATAEGLDTFFDTAATRHVPAIGPDGDLGRSASGGDPGRHGWDAEVGDGTIELRGRTGQVGIHWLL